jgi:hypothetical protein
LFILKFCSCTGPRLLELIEAILKAAVHARNMKPRSSSDHSVFVRQKCSGSEGSDAAWAVEKILEFVVKEKEDVYRRLSPISRSVLAHFKKFLRKFCNQNERNCVSNIFCGSASFIAMVMFF